MYGNPNNNMFFNVNGYEGALQFSCLPNQTVLLLDTQNPYLYMKQANQMGQATIKTFMLMDSEHPIAYKKTSNGMGQATLEYFLLKSVSEADLRASMASPATSTMLRWALPKPNPISKSVAATSFARSTA